jgi:hypothetical protein
MTQDNQPAGANRHSRADSVQAHEKSVVLGGSINLFPVEPHLTREFAEKVKRVIKEAEAAAYCRGVDDARAAMRRTLGLK